MKLLTALVGYDSGEPGSYVEPFRNVIDLRPSTFTADFRWFPVIEGLEWLAGIFAERAELSRAGRCAAAARAARSFTGFIAPAPYHERWESTHQSIETQAGSATVEEEYARFVSIDPEDRSEAYRVFLREL
jgi:hypothetical protein